ncbi:ABC transporter substrate-binding protein [Haloactinopolyspora alba]|nr:sugar ABC transporter substrate-binding protein [Haloactinopolyspora alba]
MSDRDRRPGLLNRRQVLRAGAGAAGAALLGRCGGGASSSGSGRLTFQTFGTPAAAQVFQDAIDAYEQQNPDANVQLERIPFPQHYQKLNTRLMAGTGPDIVRIQYQRMGRYIQEGALADLSDHLPPGYADEFVPNVWSAVTENERPYGFPVDTGAHVLFYNTEIFDRLGITTPNSLEDAWRWDEFLSVAHRIKESGIVPYSVAMSWQPADNAYRWTGYLYQHGGRLLNADLTRSEVNTDAARETVEFTRSWFTDGLAPPDTSIKSGTQIQTLFANGDIAMMINGDFQTSFLQANMPEGWDATYLIRDVDTGNMLGGNGLAVTNNCAEPELAADFLKFLNNEENQLRIVLTSQLLPTRRSLAGRSAKELGYEFRPDIKDLALEHLPTVSETAVSETTSPAFGEINQALGDELEAAFKSGQSPDDTVAHLDQRIQDSLGSEPGG